MSQIFLPFQAAIDFMSKGGVVMLPILLCSVVAMTIIFERLYYFAKTHENPDTTFDAMRNFLKDEEHPTVMEFSEESHGPIGKLFQSGLDHKDIPKWKLEEKLFLVGREEIYKLGKHIRGLEVIAIIAPLMGLLGTVVGMVEAFSKVAELKGQVDPSVLAGGIWEALLTTAAGMTVAIPAVIMLHFFDRRIEKITFFLEKCGQLLIHHFDEEHWHHHSGQNSGQRHFLEPTDPSFTQSEKKLEGKDKIA